MKTSFTSKLIPLGALAFSTLAPLATAAPGDVTAPAQAAQQAESSAASALALLPQQTEGFFVLPELGEKIQSLIPFIRSLIPVNPQIASVNCIAVSAGAGATSALDTLIPLAMHLGGVNMLNDFRDTWKESAKDELRPIIDEVIDNEQKNRFESIKKSIIAAKLSPIYCVLTATPGKEDDFEAIFRMMQTKLDAQKIPDAQPVTWNGFSGVQLPRKGLLRLLSGSALAQDADIARAYEQGSIYVLIKKQGAAITYIICSDLADISLPATPAESLLASPIASDIAKAAAEGEERYLIGWAAPELIQVYANNYRLASYPSLPPTISRIFEKISAVDTANAPIYQAAAQSITQISDGLFPQPPAIRKPATVSIWTDATGLHIRSTYDAMGAHYEAGELHLSPAAEDPSTIFFAECTALTASSMPKIDTSAEALLSIAKGFTLTMREQDQDIIAPKLQFAELFVPELNAVCAALKTVQDGLKAPAGLLISKRPAEEKTAASETEAQQFPVSVGIYTAVKNRPALAAGWTKLLAAAQQAATKLGSTEDISAMLPIVASSLPEAVARYIIVAPQITGATQPQLTVSDNSFVLGTHTNISDTMLSLAKAPGEPFRGAFARLNIASLATFIPDPLFFTTSQIVSHLTFKQVDENGVLIDHWTLPFQAPAMNTPSK